MPGNTAVKSTARVSLKKFWPQAIACIMVLAATVFIAVYFCFINQIVLKENAYLLNIPILIIYSFSAVIPILFGVLRFFWRSTAGTVDSLLSLFYYYGDRRIFLRLIGFSVTFIIKNVLVAAVTFLPYIITRITSLLPHKIFPESFSLQLDIISGVLFLIGAVFFVLATLKYYPAPMLFVGCEDKHWTEVFYIAKHVSRYTSGPFVILAVGFIGWMLLSLLGVTVVFTLPYMFAAYSVHCRYAFNYYNHSIKLLDQTDFPEFRSVF